MKASLALAVGALLVASVAQAQTARPLAVSMTSYAFAPSTLTLNAGQTYRVHFSNDSGKSHDFAAREFFASSTIAPEDKAKIEEDGEVELESGQAADITLTPNRSGTYPATCTHFMHAMLGMSGKIVVQ